MKTKIYSIDYIYYRYIDDFWYSDNNENGTYLLEGKNKKDIENNCIDIIKHWLINQKIISSSDQIKIVASNIQELK